VSIGPHKPGAWQYNDFASSGGDLASTRVAKQYGACRGPVTS